MKQYYAVILVSSIFAMHASEKASNNLDKKGELLGQIPVEEQDYDCGRDFDYDDCLERMLDLPSAIVLAQRERLGIICPRDQNPAGLTIQPYFMPWPPEYVQGEWSDQGIILKKPDLVKQLCEIDEQYRKKTENFDLLK